MEFCNVTMRIRHIHSPFWWIAGNITRAKA
ncbi:hypothetical protein CCUS01_09105 [Colletotrichum cuscutae]|uniref:Uncharacterized protein n=1 Tax=Colletotrichum cuscutae TaxID=1209917 RepID=A0AAI9UK35_9PEZI|nr:hypothetical protein CCUS01_09105 [Colletotrichum cuscutae]